jgi:ABC-2 type transport system permease protein
MLAVFLRELKAYFTTPIGFIFVGFFILMTGLFFALSSLLNANPNYNQVMDTITIVLLIAVPILTMRLLSEETKQGTDKLLVTSPLSITGIVLGKYLAAVAVFLLALAITVTYPVILTFFATEGLAGWEIAGAYLGFFLLGSSLIAVGLFFSSLTENQLIAAVETFAALLFVWFLDVVSKAAPSSAASGVVFLAVAAAGLALLVFFGTRSTSTALLTGLAAAGVAVLLYVFQAASFPGLIGRVLDWFSLLKRYEPFIRGILSLSPIVYYISLCGVFIFLTVRMIEKGRWI